MVDTLPAPEGSPLHKPLVAEIGESEERLGAIEICRDRLKFVHLRAIPEEPNFWSVRRISGVLLCGFDWFIRFLETSPADELGVVLAVHNADELSASIRAGVSSVITAPWSGEVLLNQIEGQLHFASERKRSALLLEGQQEILEMVARGAGLQQTIEAVALLMEKVEPDLRCAVSTLN